MNFADSLLRHAGARGAVLLLILFWAARPAMSQSRVNPDSLWRIQYQQRIRKARLNGIYIPQNLGDAHRQLNRLISPEAREKFKRMSENQVKHKLFFSLNRWICVNWSLYEGSRLGESLRRLGLYHPEDQATFIIITYHRKLNGRPLDAKSLIESLAAQRKKYYANRRKVIKVVPVPAPNSD